MQGLVRCLTELSLVTLQSEGVPMACCKSKSSCKSKAAKKPAKKKAK
jgi:hypothetical protein